VIIRTAEIFRIEDGRMAEHWDVVDDSDMKRKAGLLPAE
jgi:predicted SnoaL-like aldol condensation-catalyzing enzyme